MKQHLVPSDLKMLTDPGKERLREWWKPELDHIVADNNFDQGVPLYVLVDEDMRSGWSFEQAMEDVKVIPLLSIGQLIQYLKEHAKDKGYVDEYYEFNLVNSGFGVGWDGELIDALWKAAVDILNAHSK